MICASQFTQLQTTNVAYMAGKSPQTRMLRTRMNFSWLAEKPRVPAVHPILKILYVVYQIF